VAKGSGESAHTPGVEVVRAHAVAMTRHDIESALLALGLTPNAWGNGADVSYDRHVHGHHKVLYCASGSIVFHIAARDVALAAGDRMELPAGVEHSATVGPDGVECVEAFRS
jgi:mannose-6-phosphate isomerase-like protein (cupin superfamily)